MSPSRVELQKGIRRAAMDLLSRREYPLKELRSKLEYRFGARPEIQQAIAQLSAENLQSDRRFVENFIHSRGLKGQGPLKIAAELNRRGVDADLVEEFIDRDAKRWFEAAKFVRSKRFGDRLPQSNPARQQQSRFLLQRGFTGSQVRGALESQ